MRSLVLESVERDSNSETSYWKLPDFGQVIQSLSLSLVSLTYKMVALIDNMSMCHLSLQTGILMEGNGHGVRAHDFWFRNPGPSLLCVLSDMTYVNCLKQCLEHRNLSINNSSCYYFHSDPIDFHNNTALEVLFSFSQGILLFHS